MLSNTATSVGSMKEERDIRQDAQNHDGIKYGPCTLIYDRFVAMAVKMHIIMSANRFTSCHLVMHYAALHIFVKSASQYRHQTFLYLSII